MISPRRRHRRPARDDPFDVVVIGGGITGAGVALDAATRGYSVALVEKADFASGTSSRSSKLVHGGLRYLQKFDLGLVREALLERQLRSRWRRTSCARCSSSLPAFGGQRPDRLLGLGLNMYDVMSRAASPLADAARDANGDGQVDWSPDRHRTIDGDEVVRADPRPRRARAHAAGTSSTTARPTTCASC